MLIPLVFRGPVADGSGYSVNARNLLLQLHNSGLFGISLENYFSSSVHAGLDQETLALFNKMANTKVDKRAAILVQVGIGSQFVNDCKWNIGYSVFETDRVPFSWVIPSNRMNAVCVPSTQNKKAFEDSGITTPVHVVPHGIPQMADDIQPLKMFSDKFNFLFVGTPQYRKGIDLTIYTYLREFGNSNDTRLICKIFTDQANEQQDMGRVRHLVTEFRKKLGARGGEVVVIPEFLPSSKLHRLYKSASALVLPSRGEGWGFAASEAAALGVPVIATNWGGPTDYLSSESAYMVGYDMVPVSNMQANPQFMLAQMEGHKWAEPDLDELSLAMRNVYKNPNDAKKKGLLAAENMAANFTWEKAGVKLMEVINKVVMEG